MTNELVPSVSIDNLVAKRDAAAERIRAAHKLLCEVNDLNRGFFGDSDVYEMWRMRLVESGDRHDFTAEDGATRQIKTMDAHYWRALMDRSGLFTFMDAEARAKWHADIDKGNVPELTHKNITATFQGLYGARGEMFERGVVALFKKLSWHYKTNTPVKLGKRIVLTRLVSTMGGRAGKLWLQGIEHDGANKLDDLVRVMSVLDGKPEPDHREGAYHACEREQWMRDGSGVNVVELHGLLSIKGFKNGNGHVLFLREDLVDKLNKIISKHHPNALPPARDP